MRYLLVSLLSKERSTSVGGGHVRSMAETACQLAKNNEVVVLSLGTTFPSALEDYMKASGVLFVSLKLNVFSLWRGGQVVYNVFKKNRIQALLCFDHFAYHYCEAVSSQIPVILVRCGGPNPSAGYPYPANAIVYSLENAEWFQEFRPKSNTLFLPNRAAKPSIKKISKDSLGVPEESAVLMRICRIDGYYDWTVIQGARLARRLERNNRSVCYVVVGAPASEAHLNNLKEEVLNIHPQTIFLTDGKYTRQAAEMLGIADFAIGTGRGLMEAALLGIKLFCPVRGCDLPVGIVQDTIQAAFRMNFSGRASFSAEEIEMSINELSGSSSEDYRDWLLAFADRYFLADQIPDRVSEFISRASLSNAHKRSALMNFRVLLFLYLPLFFSRKRLAIFFKRLSK